MTQPLIADPPKRSMAYTVYLFVLSGLAVMSVFSHEMFIAMVAKDDSDGVITALFRCIQATELICAALGITAGCLRVYGSRLATPATAAVSILLIVWFPLGTAAFIWWVARVRKQERGVGG